MIQDEEATSSLVGPSGEAVKGSGGVAGRGVLGQSVSSRYSSEQSYFVVAEAGVKGE